MSLFIFAAVASTSLALVGYGQQIQGWDRGSGVKFQHPSVASLRDHITAATSATPPRAMTATGLAGVMGGIEVKILGPGTNDLLLPMPQLADSQAPVAYSISCVPEIAVEECRIQERANGNAFVNLKLKGAINQELKISWSSVVLVGAKLLVTNETRAEEYLAPTACAQSEDKQITELANKLWPAGGKPAQFARAIQEFVRDLKQKSQPRSMDAVGILGSGANWICTANANLACALMRARQLPCRSLAVVPPISRRLEMHRVVEYFENGKWVSFDPSWLQPDVPLKPWHEVIMAKTTIADEQSSMKPRMGSALGCPIGQEVEISNGLTLSGAEFYWTVAAPLVQFGVTDDAARLTVEAWKQFLKTGVVTEECLSAASATGLESYIAAWKSNQSPTRENVGVK